MIFLTVSTGEEWFTFGWPHALILGLLTLIYLLLTFANKLPSMASFKDFADTINSAGGHIIILTLFSAWFFVAAMRFFFHILAMPGDTITKENALVMIGVTFVTGTAFGGAWGALLKTMSGVKANGVAPSPTPDIPVAAPTIEEKKP
jgi:hypothetical protein